MIPQGFLYVFFQEEYIADRMLKKTLVVFILGLLELGSCFVPGTVDRHNCKKQFGRFPKTGSACGAFYECARWIPETVHCPRGQHFFPAKQQCVPRDQFPCLEKESKGCLRPNGKFLKPGTGCKSYYDCCRGVPTEKRCLEDRLFNPRIQSCEWPEVYSCIEVETSSVMSTKGDRSSSEESSSEESDENRSSVTEVRSSTLTPHPKSSEEDSDESNERHSTASHKSSLEPRTSPNSETSDGGGTVFSTMPIKISSESPTSNSVSLGEISGKSTNDGFTSNWYSERTPITSELTSLTKNSEDDTTSSSLESTSITEGDTNLPLTDVTSFSLGTTSVDEKNIVSTISKTDLTSPGVVSSSENEETRESTVSETNLTTSSTPPILVSEDGTASEKEFSKPSISSKALTDAENDWTLSTIESSSVTGSDGNLTTLNIFCPEPNGYFPHPYDRHKFIGCVGGDPRILECPSNLVYDHGKRACVYDKTR